MNNLNFLTEFVESNEKKSLYAPGGKKELLDEQGQEWQQWFKESKKFYLSVEKSQSFYDSFEPIKNRIKNIEDFKLPFDVTTLVFEKPLKIKWINKERTADEDTLIMGFTIKFLHAQDMVDSFFDLYKIYLVFDEGKIEDLPAVSHQFIMFAYNKTGSEEFKPLGIFPQHYPCRNEKYCMVNYENGLLKKWAQEINPKLVCQEINNRQSLAETLLNLIEKIHESEIEYRTKKTNGRFNPEGKVLPVKPFGWPFTKGNLPKENYVQYLDGKSYRYDPEQIAHGTGTEHRYRYDVRRHPRVVGNKIIWIEPHIRGAGKYIPKVYANRKTWFVNYLWYQAEKLTKYRMFEILLIRIINIFKK